MTTNGAAATSRIAAEAGPSADATAAAKTPVKKGPTSRFSRYGTRSIFHPRNSSPLQRLRTFEMAEFRRRRGLSGAKFPPGQKQTAFTAVMPAWGGRAPRNVLPWRAFGFGRRWRRPGQEIAAHLPDNTEARAEHRHDSGTRLEIYAGPRPNGGTRRAIDRLANKPHRQRLTRRSIEVRRAPSRGAGSRC